MEARLISNSGGRTSGYMTWLAVQEGLRATDFICFANTGKEKEETLEFLHQQELNWGIKIYWLEYCKYNKWKEVDFYTASRNGEPFVQMLDKKQFLPNVMTRWCTQELKIRVMKNFMRSQGFSTWENLVGLRYDEQKRVSRNKAGSKQKQRWVNSYPLNDLRLTSADVLSFWKEQPFDLQLLPHEGNCDLCFMKGRAKQLDILRRNPEVAIFWDEVEKAMQSTFSSRFKVSDLLAKAQNQTSLFDIDEYISDEIDCSCTD